MLKKIISGAQTGADIAGLEVGKKFGLETGGWMPFAYKTQDGCKPEYKQEYGVMMHHSSTYPPRTRLNVKESDGTIRFASNFESAGEKCTFRAIQSSKKPHFDVDLNLPFTVENAREVARWIVDNNIQVLNVAGNSERTAPGTHAKTTECLTQILECLNEQKS